MDNCPEVLPDSGLELPELPWETALAGLTPLTDSPVMLGH